MNNPFSLDFGALPNLHIPRLNEINQVISSFSSEKPSSHVFVVMGARGSGKTVFMTDISRKLRDREEWVHYDLNSEGDILLQFASSLYLNNKNILKQIKLSVQIAGVEISYDKEERYTNIQMDIDKMLAALNKKGRRVLVTIDEAVNSKAMREFSAYFQHAIREELPIFVLMTGLYKNIQALQNNRSLTFLRRAPKITLGALKIERIAKIYEDVFSVTTDNAIAIAKETAGYSYAFQILGYLLFEAGQKSLTKDIIFEYKTNLEEVIYEKMWEELSENERKVAAAIAKLPDNSSTNEILGQLDMDSNNYSTYKNTLVKSGILSSTTSFGHESYNLPYLKEFVLKQ